MAEPIASILFPEGANETSPEPTGAPAFFVDLALDQIVEAITAGRDDYDLKPLFYALPHEVEIIAHRHAVMRDLENDRIMACIVGFCQAMRGSRHEVAIAGKMHYPHQADAGFLDAVDHYCHAVRTLGSDLAELSVESRGLKSLLDYLETYIGSADFHALVDGVAAIRRDLATIRYTILLRDSSVSVRAYDGEADYSAEVAATFAKFQQGDAKTYDFKFSESGMMNHVEAEILKGVSILYASIFATLGAFRARHENFIDPVIGRFDRDINFYVAYLDFIRPFKALPLNFSYPEIAVDDKDIRVRDSFDLALAGKLRDNHLPIVCNDFHLEGQERIFVVTGPNQGGKTTFARMFGQIHYLAHLGCPVPGRDARLFLFDRMFTHFEKAEALTTLRGKLNDDLVRVRRMLNASTPRSLIVMNEIFNSTSLQDAVFLAQEILRRIIALDALGVCVTFMDELASLGPRTVSVASTVVPDDPAERTFKIIRKPADGLAHALSIAEKYRVTYASLKERLGP